MDVKFFTLGIIAATIANMTGTGGGIVFFPAFVALGITPAVAAATSMVIQAFGMTSGSISWLVYFRQRRDEFILILCIAFIASVFSILGAYSYIFFIKAIGINIHLVFRALSLCIAILLIINYFMHEVEHKITHLPWIDYGLIVLVAFVGGVLTAVVSIGVGELLASLLMLRRFHPDMAIAAAVIVSAATVIAIAPHFALVVGNVHQLIAISAIPGVLIGGYAARYIAKAVSLRKLKLIFIAWVLLSSFL